MAITDRVRGFAGRVGQRLMQFSASTSPTAPGFEPASPDKVDRNERVARQLRSEEALRGRVTYYSGPTQDRYSSYPGTGLEPQTIWNLQLLRNNGYPQLWCELIEQIVERDGHLGGIFETRRLSVVDKPFRVHPARRGDLLAELLAKILERIVDGVEDFDQTIEDLLHASAYGYAISEIVWADRKVRIPTKGGIVSALLQVPVRIDWVHQKHIRFDRWTDEPYLYVGSGSGEFSLPPNKFIFHAGTGSGLREKRGFMGSCAWLSAAKRWTERDWLVYAKIFGIPNILGKYPNGMEEYEQHKSKYQAMLRDWGEGIPILVPDDLVPEITREPGGRAGDLHGSVIGWANSELSKRILGSTLTVEIGNQGAYAAADTHRDAPYMRSRADARKLAGSFRRDLFMAFLTLNRYALANVLGSSPEEILEVVPRCSWRIEREMTPQGRQTVYEGAVNNLGVEVDEEQYRDEMGLDAPRPGGRALRGKPVPVGTGGLAPSVEASQDGAEPPAKDPPQLPPKKNDDDDGGASNPPISPQ